MTASPTPPLPPTTQSNPPRDSNLEFASMGTFTAITSPYYPTVWNSSEHAAHKELGLASQAIQVQHYEEGQIVNIVSPEWLANFISFAESGGEGIAPGMIDNQPLLSGAADSGALDLANIKIQHTHEYLEAIKIGGWRMVLVNIGIEYAHNNAWPIFVNLSFENQEGDDENTYNFMSSERSGASFKVREGTERKRVTAAHTLHTTAMEPAKSAAISNLKLVANKHTVPTASQPFQTFGIENLGNSCYMSAPLQCLFSIEELAQIFAEPVWETFIANMNTQLLGIMQEKNVNLPMRGDKTLGDITPTFRGQTQQDAHELLVFVLDELHEDLNSVLQKSTDDLPSSQDYGDVTQLAEKFFEEYEKRDVSVIVDLFRGWLMVTRECLNPSCHAKVSVRFDPFIILSLPIPTREVRVKAVPLEGPARELHLRLPRKTDETQLQEVVAEAMGWSNWRFVSIVPDSSKYDDWDGVDAGIIEAFESISMDFSKDLSEATHTTVIDCIQMLCESELLNDFECSNCGQLAGATRKMDIWSLPDVRIIVTPSSDGAERVTVLLTGNMTGQRLKPMVLFKGAEGGPNKKKVALAIEQRMLHVDVEFNKKGFVDEDYMLS
ncbi:CSN-associated deubiquitinating enzyme Ubp12, partial [Chytridiales sp. JEL 0842]